MLVSGGRIVDPAQNLDALRDLRIRNGRIVEIGEHLRREDDEEAIDATGAFVAPGFIDMHVHLREPGSPEKETLATGTAAAVAGGFTSVAAMPNTNPPLDSAQLVQSVRFTAPKGGIACRVYPIACITQGRAGAQPAAFAALERAGAVAFSDDGSTVMNARVLYDCAMQARDMRAPFILHCEDVHLKGGAYRSEAANAIAEDVIVARDMPIAKATAKAWHVAHLSTAGALASVRQARAQGVAVTCEVTPHHLFFTNEAIDELGGRAKVNPPLRDASDVEALRTAVRSGEIDLFASDHAPHTAGEKDADLSCAAVGFSGLEVAAGAYALALPGLPLLQYVAMISSNAARIFNLPGGTLAAGSPADVTIFADRSWTVRPERFRSKGKSTPFAGMTLPRMILHTIIDGNVVYAAG